MSRRVDLKVAAGWALRSFQAFLCSRHFTACARGFVCGVVGVPCTHRIFVLGRYIACLLLLPLPVLTLCTRQLLEILLGVGPHLGRVSSPDGGRNRLVILGSKAAARKAGGKAGGKA